MVGPVNPQVSLGPIHFMLRTPLWKAAEGGSESVIRGLITLIYVGWLPHDMAPRRAASVSFTGVTGSAVEP